MFMPFSNGKNHFTGLALSGLTGPFAYVAAAGCLMMAGGGCAACISPCVAIGVSPIPLWTPMHQWSSHGISEDNWLLCTFLIIPNKRRSSIIILVIRSKACKQIFQVNAGIKFEPHTGHHCLYLVVHTQHASGEEESGHNNFLRSGYLWIGLLFII